MTLIYCPECKKQISNRAEACPHCGLPQTYFAPEGEIEENITPGSKEEIQKADYKTIRNMLIAFDRDYVEIFNTFRYIASSNTKSFYKRYEKYLEILKNPLTKNYIKNNSIALGFTIEQVNRFISLLEGFYEKVDNLNEEYIQSKLVEYKEYFDNILKNVDPNVMLDEEQRRGHCPSTV